MEGDIRFDEILNPKWAFQSTPSAWRETSPIPRVLLVSAISIHSLRMEGDCCIRFFFISIFVFQSTPSAWRETWQKLTSQVIAIYFNPLPPHGGRRLAALRSVVVLQFQSTPSAWRETEFTLHGKEYEGISIHSLRMEGDRITNARCCVLRNFNPLPPHGGRRLSGTFTPRTDSLFQSTPSAWRET